MYVMKPPRSRPLLPSFPLEPVKTTTPAATLALEETKQLHAHLLRVHYHPTPAVSINALVTSYTINADPSAALLVYAQARSSGRKLEDFTVPSVLKACGRVPSLRWGREAHGYAVKTGLVSDLFVRNSLMQMYSECRDVGLARRVFDGMPERDVVSWSTMIGCCRRNGCLSEGLELVGRFSRLMVVRPSEVAMLNMVGLFADIAASKLSRAVHAYVMKNDGSGPKLDAALIDMYVKCGSTGRARRVFDGMPARNTACWTSMMVGCIRAGDLGEGVRLFRAMQEQDLIPNEITMLSMVIECGEAGALPLGDWLHVYMLKNGFAMSTALATALVDMYAKCGRLKRARRLFDESHGRDVTAWTAMISGYAKAACLNQAIQLFGLMRRKKVKPIGTAMVALLCACGEAGALDVGRRLHGVIGKEGIDLDDVVLTTALVDMYSKCGDVDGARRVFSTTSTKGDTCMWNAMMNGLALHGNGKEALQLFSRMEEERVKPNHATFVGLLHACSHSGLVAEGEGLFVRMECDFGLGPKVEHYGCMVDVLARAGLVDEAHEMVKSMPMKPNAVVWGSLLAGCKIHRNAGLGEVAARKILEMEPENTAYNVLLSNMYAGDDRWEDAADVRRSIKDMGGKQEPGFSSVELNKLAMEDASHPHSKKIYKLIARAENPGVV